MFWIKVFIALLNFSRSLKTRCVSLDNESCTIRPTLIDSNPVELSYNPFIITLDKCNRNCNAVDVLTTEKCVPCKIS